MKFAHRHHGERPPKHGRVFAAISAAGSVPVGLSLFGATLVLVAGCPGTVPPPGPPSNGGPVYNNTTDPTNRNAKYLGSQACESCHPDVAAEFASHGHGWILNRVQGTAPTYPPVGSRAIVPDPPPSFTWKDIAYVLGGYTKRALFIDTDGYVLTHDVDGVDTQWNLQFKPNGTPFGFVPYDEEPGEFSPTNPQPFDYDCIVCHTTGPMPQDPNNPMFQESRPGILGTWNQAGVQCEACHGPGSNHVPNPPARDNFVDTSASFCGECHNRPHGSDPTIIMAEDGYITFGEQYSELLASGGHSKFSCVTCHDPHVSVAYDRSNAIVNDCKACHSDMNMALHEGFVFFRGDYSETLTCESCHMPFADKNAAAAGPDVVGPLGRMGDGRSHLFRIDVNEVTFTNMFSADMKTVRLDGNGRSAVTVDFVCLRCHNGVGNAFPLKLSSASEIAFEMHGVLSGQEASKQASERNGPHE